MKANILYKNGVTKIIYMVRSVSNASTKIDNDMVYIYRYGDIRGEPSVRIPVKDIVCVEVTEC